jgi:hypothetical protein
LPGQNPDGSRIEPSGRGYFPGPLNGADVTVKGSKRYAASLKQKNECAYCQIASAKKDDVWTQFYPSWTSGISNLRAT